LFVDDCGRFLDPKANWAARAAALGWTAETLFGCASTQPLAHLQVAGLVWVLRGRRIVRLYPDWAFIEDSADSSRYVFNRRVTYGAPIALLGRCDDRKSAMVKNSKNAQKTGSGPCRNRA
jgi:hypothetical protein